MSDLQTAHGPAFSRGLLPGGLRRLIFLRYKAFFRRMVFGSAKRKIFTVIGFAMMAMYMLPRMLNSKNVPFTPEGVRLWLPVFLIGFTIIQLLARARRDPMMFMPAEIDLVVPGPFSRRQLVLYQIIYQVGPLVAIGLWMGIFIRSGGSYLSSALGIMLVFFGINLLSGIINTSIGLVNAKSRLILPAVLALLGVAVYLAARGVRAFPESANYLDWVKWAEELRRTPIIEALCLPARPYAETLAGQTVLESLPWGILATGMNIVLIAVFIALDRGEVESLVVKSQERLAKFEKARRSGIANPEKAARRQVPMLPRMGGAGTLIWRQLTWMYRGGGPWVLLSIPLAILASTIWLGAVTPAEGLLPIMLISGIGGCFGVSLVLRSDFRSDLEHMAMLKTLPLTPMTIVIGQLASPIIVASVVQCLVSLGLAIGSLSPKFVLYGIGISLALIPLSAVLVTIENTVFLIAPTRSMKSSMQGGVDPSQFGRTMIITLGKLLASGGAGAIIGFPTWLAYHFGGFFAAVPVGLALTFGLLYGLALACSKAFTMFDVADDQPA